MQQLSLFDFLDNAEDYKAIKSNDWKWTMANDYPSEKNGLKVFSMFACGGGSTMGYKLAGCEVLGCVEIDKRMNDVYVKNHNPKYNYLMDIRDFNKLEDLPIDLFNLDILDGSPPCTTFSIAGDREDAWGKKKKFREGQSEQTLDDLSFVFIDSVAKLRPKVVIMENVEGLLFGNAWRYVQKIYTQFHSIGYKVKHWLLKGENMGVPQKRHRIFFIATRLDFDLDKIDLVFNYEPVYFGDIKSEFALPVVGETYNDLFFYFVDGDYSLADANIRRKNQRSFFNNMWIYDNKVAPTLIAKRVCFRADKKQWPSDHDIISMSTFPVDFDFIEDSNCFKHYVCGMSVPPIMIKRVVIRLIKSGIFDY